MGAGSLIGTRAGCALATTRTTAGRRRGRYLWGG